MDLPKPNPDRVLQVDPASGFSESINLRLLLLQHLIDMIEDKKKFRIGVDVGGKILKFIFFNTESGYHHVL